MPLIIFSFPELFDKGRQLNCRFSRKNFIIAIPITYKIEFIKLRINKCQVCIYEKRSLKMNESFVLEETKHDTREGQRFTRACAFRAESSTFRLLFLPTSFYRKIIMLNFIIVPSLNACNQSFENYFDRAREDDRPFQLIIYFPVLINILFF